MRERTRIILLLSLSVLVSSTLSFFILSHGQTWPDDFAAYIMQAKSILSGTMPEFVAHNSFTIQNSSYPPGPVAYPWGFPLLLAPVYAIFGMSPMALKLVNIVFYAIFLICFYQLARTRLPAHLSLLLTGIFSVLPVFLAASDLIISDIPFLCLSTLSLVLIERVPKQKLIAGILCGAVVFGAFFLRTNGVLLFAPLFGCLFLEYWPAWQPGLRKAVPPVLTFIIFLVIQVCVFPGGQESYLSHFSMFSIQGFLNNMAYYLWLPATAFDGIPGGAVAYPTLFVFVIISLLFHFKRDIALHSYSVFTLILFVFWPERQGLRFIYPILPAMFITAADGMLIAISRIEPSRRLLGQRIMYGIWGIIYLAGLSIGISMAIANMAGGRDINGPFDQYSSQMFGFIRQQTPAQSVIIFMRPRTMRLFTDHDSFMTDRCEDLIKGDYVVLHDKMGANGQISPNKILACDPNLRLAKTFANKRFTVYKINH